MLKVSLIIAAPGNTSFLAHAQAILKITYIDVRFKERVAFEFILAQKKLVTNIDKRLKMDTLSMLLVKTLLGFGTHDLEVLMMTRFLVKRRSGCVHKIRIGIREGLMPIFFLADIRLLKLKEILQKIGILYTH
jgi:hypothetical protein